MDLPLHRKSHDFSIKKPTIYDDKLNLTFIKIRFLELFTQNPIFVEAGKELTMITPSGTLYYKDKSPAYYMQQLGHKQYELTNHLGNVQAVVSDRKDRIADDVDPKKLGFFVADMASYTDYYPFGWAMPGRRYNQGEYEHGYNGQRKVNEVKGEGNHYTAEFWEYDPRAVHRWNTDPRPNTSFSPYAVMQGNPVLFSDHAGDSVRGTTSAARSGMAQFGERTRTTKKGKEKSNTSFEPAFGEIYEKWKNDPTILVNFTTISGEDYGGTISYDGVNEDGLQVYNVFWDPSQTRQLGASGIFEETFHLMEVMEGKEMEFAGPGLGVKNLDIYDEVRAKQWVANSIKSMKPTFVVDKQTGARGYTHYGFIRKLNDKDVIAEALMRGVEERAPLPSSQNRVLGGIELYTPANFGGKYGDPNHFSPIAKP